MHPKTILLSLFRDLPLTRKIILAILSVVLGSCIVSSLVVFYSMKSSLLHRTFLQLESDRDLKVARTEAFFARVNGQFESLAHHPALVAAASGKAVDLRKLFRDLEASPTSSDFANVWLLDGGRRPIFSERPGMLPTQIAERISGEQGETRVLNDTFSRHDGFSIWLVHGVPGGGVLVANVSGEKIVSYFEQRSGLGATGESYLVGSDGLLRTFARFSRGASNESTPIHTAPFLAAMARGSGEMVARDYRRQEVLSKYRSFEWAGAKWVALSEIDYDEAMAPLHVLLATLLSAWGILIFLSFFVATFLAAQIGKLEAGQARLRQLAAYEGQEIERARMSRDLHDGICQQLMALSLKTGTGDWDASSAKELQHRITDVIAEVRRLSNDLSPAVLQSFGAVAAIRELCKSADRSGDGAGTEVGFVSNLDPGSAGIPDRISRPLFRIAQEALQNMAKHSGAGLCEVSLNAVGDSGKKEIELRIFDNGRGLASGPKASGNGLNNIKMRAAMLGGTAEFHSVPGEFTEVHVRVPWPETIEGGQPL